MQTLEPLVAGIFKLTLRQARGLVDSTFAKYSARLAGDVREQVRQALDDAVEGDNDAWVVTLRSRYVESRLMDFLATKPVDQAVKMTVGGRWRFTKDAINAAANEYGAQVRP